MIFFNGYLFTFYFWAPCVAHPVRCKVSANAVKQDSLSAGTDKLSEILTIRPLHEPIDFAVSAPFVLEPEAWQLEHTAQGVECDAAKLQK